MGSSWLGQRNSAKIGSLRTYYAFYVRNSPSSTRKLAVAPNPHLYNTLFYIHSTVLRPVGCTESIIDISDLRCCVFVTQGTNSFWYVLLGTLQGGVLIVLMEERQTVIDCFQRTQSMPSSPGSWAYDKAVKHPSSKKRKCWLSWYLYQKGLPVQ